MPWRQISHPARRMFISTICRPEPICWSAGISVERGRQYQFGFAGHQSRRPVHRLPQFRHEPGSIDSNNVADLFVYDAASNATFLVSVNGAGNSSRTTARSSRFLAATAGRSFSKAGRRICPAMISTATATFLRSTSPCRCTGPAAAVRLNAASGSCGATDSRRRFRFHIRSLAGRWRSGNLIRCNLRPISPTPSG